MIVSDIIRSSLRLINRLGPGRGAGPSELVDALFVLNAMLDAWNTERLSIYSVQPTNVPLIAGQQAYPITPRFESIENANVILSTGLRLPVHVLTRDEWAAIPLQNVGSTIPTQIYADGGVPTTTIYVWPYPSANLTLELYLWQQIAQFATVSDVVTLPAGYLDAIRYELATRLAAEWHEPLRDDVLMRAQEAKRRIKSVNTETRLAAVDAGLLTTPRFFDWRTG